MLMWKLAWLHTLHKQNIPSMCTNQFRTSIYHFTSVLIVFYFISKEANAIYAFEWNEIRASVHIPTDSKREQEKKNQNEEWHFKLFYFRIDIGSSIRVYTLMHLQRHHFAMLNFQDRFCEIQNRFFPSITIHCTFEQNWFSDWNVDIHILLE